MNVFIQAFKDKRLRYGAFSTLTALFVIAILIIINLLAGQLNLSYDLTQDKLYSLSERTEQALADLDKDIVIYALFRPGDTDYYVDIIRELLDGYPRVSDRISLEYIDPYLYPQFVEQFREGDESIPSGSVIVTGADRFKVIPVNDLVSQDIDYQTYEMYISSVDVEPQVTNAILYVQSGESPVVYTLTGHNETPVPESLRNRLTAANYEVRELNLFNAEMPGDCGALFITTPERDWSAEEAAAIAGYLEGGGRALFFIDYTSLEYPNMDGVLSAYGIEFINGLVFEGNPDYYFLGLQWNLLPGLAQHEITQPILDKGYPNILPMARAIRPTELKRQATQITPLMITSSSSYAKTDLTGQDVNKTPDDIDGPFILSAAIEDADFSAKLVVTAGSSILDESLNNNYVMGANYDYVMACLNWTQEKSDNVYISPKAPASAQLMMSSGEALAVIGVSLAIPVAILLFGAGVWFRRRSS